ncbi:DUF4336 domain-containing protein [Vibrio viridaestus]|uniref:DUF4336 domain-containing protein n=1 Tax=Vibrio viridaestus TaxID=2487322 RepID=A0A3N9TCU5_9VIBR|nr:DUF4336 domain-containing protein [Vibrio viridaestus]RQW61889.1 DUF4336 domain-containing protein [Vibrio viridaestus]
MYCLDDNIWLFEGEPVRFMGLPYTTRMTVIRLSDQSLWVHSPIRLTSEIQYQIEQLGSVKYLVAPNALHHLFLNDWLSDYPQALLFGTKGVIQKRPDIHFQHTLTTDFSAFWTTDIEFLLFTGSKVMEEAVFFYAESRTLIVTDLIENFSPKNIPILKRPLAKMAGILTPHGKTPLDWRLTFCRNKDQVRRHIKRISSWNPKTIVMAHGEIITQDALPFLHRSFAWAN